MHAVHDDREGSTCNVSDTSKVSEEVHLVSQSELVESIVKYSELSGGKQNLTAPRLDLDVGPDG